MSQWRHYKNNGKIWTSAKPDKLYISKKLMMKASRKCNFYCNWMTDSKAMAIQVEFLPILVDLTMTCH